MLRATFPKAWPSLWTGTRSELRLLLRDRCRTVCYVSNCCRFPLVSLVLGHWSCVASCCWLSVLLVYSRPPVICAFSLSFIRHSLNDLCQPQRVGPHGRSHAGSCGRGRSWFSSRTNTHGRSQFGSCSASVGSSRSGSRTNPHGRSQTGSRSASVGSSRSGSHESQRITHKW